MIRRLPGLLFVACLSINALGSVALVGEEDECGASCCRSSKQTRPTVRPSRDCCYSECEQPAETQPTSPKGVPAIERIFKIHGSVAASAVDPLARQSSQLRQSPRRNVIQSAHIYLRTGTLLI